MTNLEEKSNEVRKQIEGMSIKSLENYRERIAFEYSVPLELRRKYRIWADNQINYLRNQE